MAGLLYVEDQVVTAVHTISGIPTSDRGSQIAYYTQQELMRNYFGGAVLVIGVLVITYIAYKLYMNKYAAWKYKKDVEDCIANGGDPRSIEAPDIKPPLSKKVQYALGLGVVICGIILYVMTKLQ